MRHRRVLSGLLAAAALVLGASAAGAQSLPTLDVGTGTTMDEQNVGSDLYIRWHLSAPATAPVEFTIETITDGDQDDFTAVPPTKITMAAGEQHGAFIIRILGDPWPEPDAHFTVRYSGLSGATFAAGGNEALYPVVLRNDDAPLQPLVAHDDHLVIQENNSVWNGWLFVYPQQNDTLDSRVAYDGTLVLTSQPQHGTATRHDLEPGQGGWPWFHYIPEADFSGIDEFGYRICDKIGRCDEGRVIVEMRPVVSVSVNQHGKSGRHLQQFSNLRALTAATWLPTPLARGQRHEFALQQDMTPDAPWDSLDGVVWTTRTIAASPGGASIEHRIHLQSSPGGEVVGMHLGVDANGDGQPSAAEERCDTLQDGSMAACDMSVIVAGEPLTYWIAVRELRGWDDTLAVNWFDVAMTDGDGSLVATGAVTADRLDPVPLTLSWHDDAWIQGDRTMAWVRVAEGGEVFGEFPVIFSDMVWDVPTLRLTPGVARTLELDAQSSYDQLFLDVPAGATALTIASSSAADFDFHVVREGAALDPSVSRVGPAPPVDQAAGSGLGPGGNHVVTISGPALVPGRWYVVPANRGPSRAAVTLTATIAAVAPVVRPGAYFNAGRAGSGLLLYPAGDQWAGLWYTYGDFERPTWYYLQAPRPGIDGIWRSGIYRDTRFGNVSRHTQVGEAVITPVGPDRFTFS